MKPSRDFRVGASEQLSNVASGLAFHDPEHDDDPLGFREILHRRQHRFAQFEPGMLSRRASRDDTEWPALICTGCVIRFFAAAAVAATRSPQRAPASVRGSITEFTAALARFEHRLLTDVLGGGHVMQNSLRQTEKQPSVLPNLACQQLLETRLISTTEIHQPRPLHPLRIIRCMR